MLKSVKQMKSIAAAAVLFAALAACGGETKVTGTDAAGTTSETSTAADSTSTWITGEQRAPIATVEGGQTVLVSIDDNNIGMPTTVVPGPVVFTVTNAGTKDHGFEVAAGDTMLKKLDMSLKPLETGSLNVDLPAGSYTIRCPIEGHVEQITVTAQK